MGEWIGGLCAAALNQNYTISALQTHEQNMVRTSAAPHLIFCASPADWLRGYHTHERLPLITLT